MARELNGWNGGPTVQEKMLAVLLDGQPHSVAELRKCQYDELSESSFLYHLSKIRQQLRLHGQTIATIMTDRVTTYQLVRVLASPYDGRK